MHAISFLPVTQSQVELNNRLSQSPVVDVINNGDTQLKYCINASDQLEKAVVKVTLRSEQFSSSIVSYFDEGIVAYACLDKVAIQAIPSEIKLALLWAQWSQWLSVISNASGFELQLIDISFVKNKEKEEPKDGAVYIGIQADVDVLNNEQYTCHGQIHFDNSDVQNVFPLLINNEFSLDLFDKTALPNGAVIGCINLAHTHLPSAELAAIQLHDVILFDEAQFIPNSCSQFNQQLTLNHCIRLQLDIEGNHATILNIENIIMHNTNTQQEPNTEPLDGQNNQLLDSQAMAQLPVNVEFLMDGIEIPLSQLTSLAPGFTFPLKVDPSRPVTAAVNGQAIARCELVDIEGQLGARVIEKIEPRAMPEEITTQINQETEERNDYE